MTAQRSNSDAEGIWYTSTYNNPEMQTVIADFRENIGRLQISESEASLRWIYYHSKLQKGDGVILEASSGPELAQHIKDIAKDLLCKRLRGP
jgi:hypothetical protein